MTRTQAQARAFETMSAALIAVQMEQNFAKCLHAFADAARQYASLIVEREITNVDEAMKIIGDYKEQKAREKSD